MIAHSFPVWWERFGQPYEDAVIAAGCEPWTRDLAERRALWQRRYTKPAPPAGLLKNPTDIRRDHTKWAPVDERTAA